MKLRKSSETIGSINPIDDLEEIVLSQGLPYLRFGKNELMIRYPDTWENMQSFWTWDPEFYSIDVIASSLLKFKDSHKEKVYELLSLVNEQMWIGHFDLTDEGTPSFRHTCLLRGVKGPYTHVVEDMFAVVLAEYQRFIPAFQFVIKNNKSPQEALNLSLIDTHGEA